MRATHGTDELTLVLAVMMGMGAFYGMVGIGLVGVTVLLDGYVPTFGSQLTLVAVALLVVPVAIKRFVDGGI